MQSELFFAKTKNRNNFIICGFCLSIALFIHLLNLKIFLPPYNVIGIFFFIGVFFSLISFKYGVVSKDVFKILLINIFSILFLLISYLFNQVVDIYFFKENILYHIVMLFSAFFIITLLDYFLSKDVSRFNFVSFLIVIVIIFQLLLSFAAYLSPGLYNIVFSIFSSPADLDNFNSFNETRMVTLGASFFGSGVVNVFTLILISFLITKENSIKILIFLLFSYFVVAVIGMFSSRSTIIGILFSLFIIFFNKHNIRVSIVIVLTLISSYFLLSNINFDNDSRFLNLVSFGLEFLFDFSNSQAAKSTSELADMWSIWPTEVKTWLIGDVFYRNENSYYMDTDVGYMRIIFANGLVGLFLFYLTHYYLLSRINQFNLFVKFVILCALITLHSKGIGSFVPFLSLLFFAALIDNKRLYKGG
ncbi:hypothetical protein [Acinetobacter junii]|uniref:hypothetical protein n=1 Tax=Acinetobacter junii TaxID=40215 RepID=UPI000F66230B|nr:hypothetical protein [Acinetobacter junii]MDH1003635.1 hypothetical protein [Acinetobacter junii]QXR27849.1 hypothetical protein EGT69_000390 [Acinetobacter junii]